MHAKQIQKAIENRVMIPEDVDISIDRGLIRVKGPKGKLEKDFNNPRYINTVFIERSGNEIIVKADADKRLVRSICGTISAHVKNMITGVTVGYRYVMKIFYTHFPISVTVKDKEVQIRNFIGEKGARIAKIVGAADAKVEKDEIIILGPDIEDVGQTAANIEQACKLSKRDRRVFQDGIYISGKFLQTGEKI